jgi:hypothetical protein
MREAALRLILLMVACTAASGGSCSRHDHSGPATVWDYPMNVSK